MQMGYDFEPGLTDADPRRTNGMRGAALVDSWPGHMPAASDNKALSGNPDLPARHPDWAGLRARFQAIHALRRALVPDSALSPRPEMASAPAGSFADLGECVLSACRTKFGVNPVYSANSKAVSATTEPVAVSPSRGDRGIS